MNAPGDGPARQPDDLVHPNVPATHRRLADRALALFHLACDARDLDVADQLLPVIEFMMTRTPRPGEENRRADLAPLVAAHDRLWVLRNPNG